MAVNSSFKNSTAQTHDKFKDHIQTCEFLPLNEKCSLFKFGKNIRIRDVSVHRIRKTSPYVLSSMFSFFN